MAAQTQAQQRETKYLRGFVC